MANKNKMRWTLRYGLFVSLASLMFTCDLGKYTGSDIDTQKLIETSKVYGLVTDYFSGDSVSSASVRVGSQEVMSALNGEYLINYLLDVSEERNKPVEISVTKADYYPQKTEIVLSPVENKFNFSLKYAAPLIQQSVRFTEDEFTEGVRHIYQAKIMDYQGIETVDRVWVRQLLVDFYGNLDSVFIDLQRVNRLDLNTAYFQADLDGVGGQDWSGTGVGYIKRFYTIWAEDNEGYRDDLTRGFRPIDPDYPIF